MTPLAPIVLFVYNRPVHTLKTLEAINSNIMAKDSELFIYSDGPKNQSDIEKVNEVRKIIRETWCKKVSIIESQENKGLAGSVIDGVSEIVNKHNKVIVLEDDIVTSKYFLKFMNEALELYKFHEKVFGISGHIHKLNIKLPETFFLRKASSWGWGTWKNAWDQFEKDGNQLKNEIEKKDLVELFNFGGKDFHNMLKQQINSSINSWAIRFYASSFLNNGLFLYPKFSLVNNIGFDGSGVHCQEASHDINGNFSQNKEIDTSQIEINECKDAEKAYEKLFSPSQSFLQKIKNKIF